MLTVRLNEIPKGGLHLDEEISKNRLADKWKDSDDDLFHFTAPARASLNLHKRHKHVALSGTVTFTVGYACSRCGADCETQLTAQIKETFLPAEEFIFERGKAYDLEPEELEQTFYTGDEIDLGQYLLDSMALELPMVPICEDNAACTETGDHVEDWGVSEKPKPENPMWKEGLKRIKLK